tara:strand:- start:1723 stop:3249 length:1527 start_codon:yes stop_codon:yes gene_type:complete
MKLSARETEPEKAAAICKDFRSHHPRRKIYCVPRERRRAFSFVMQHARALVEDKADIPEVLLVNTWDASTKCIESDGRVPGYIIYDFQTSNRLDFLSRAYRIGFDAFDSFLNHIAVFLELCVAADRHDRAERLLAHFEKTKPDLLRHLIRAHAEPRQDEMLSLEAIWVDGNAFLELFLQGFLLGHEIGHFLYPEFQQGADGVVELRSVHHDVTSISGDGFALAKNGFSDGEFVFVDGKAMHLRAFRGGSEEMMEGLKRRIARENIRSDNQEIQEFYCDIVGLALGLHVVNEAGMAHRISAYWLCLYHSIISQAYLNYLAFSWSPVESGSVAFCIPPLYERFVIPLRLFAARPEVGGLLPRLGWREDGLGKVREFASGWSGKDEEWAEALSFTMHEMVGYETIRAFGGIDLAMSGGRHSGFWEKTEGLSFGDLFSPPNERVSAVPNYLFGPQMGCRFILQGLAEEWGDLRGGRPTPMADEDREAIETRVISFRGDWRDYIFQSLNDLSA